MRAAARLPKHFQSMVAVKPGEEQVGLCEHLAACPNSLCSAAR